MEEVSAKKLLHLEDRLDALKSKTSFLNLSVTSVYRDWVSDNLACGVQSILYEMEHELKAISDELESVRKSEGWGPKYPPGYPLEEHISREQKPT